MAKKPFDDDLFQDSTMTFGEHLEELRGVLFKALYGLALGVILGLFVGGHVVEFIQAPLRSALEDYYQKKAVRRLQQSDPTITDDLLAEMQDRNIIFERVMIDPQDLLNSLSSMYPQQLGGVDLPGFGIQAENIKDFPRLVKDVAAGDAATEASPARRVWQRLGDRGQRRWRAWAKSEQLDGDDQRAIVQHLNELLDDAELFDADEFAASKLNAEFIKRLKKLPEAGPSTRRRENWLLLSSAFDAAIRPPQRALSPLLLWRQMADDTRVSVKTMNAQEAFMIYLKASMIAGVILSSPWVLYQIWIFVAAGLYPHEKHYVHIFLPFSLFLFLAGAALAYFAVFAPVLKFLLGFNDWLGLDPDPRISEWLSFVLWLPLTFGISFQLPLVMLFVAKLGILDSRAFLAKWRVAVLGIFIGTAVFSPTGDPGSMLMLAAPVTLLYFLGILLVKRVERNRERAV